MARKKARKTARKSRRKSTTRRGGPTLASLSARVTHLETHAIIRKKKHAPPKRFAGTADEVY